MSLNNDALIVWKNIRVYVGEPVTTRPDLDTFDVANPTIPEFCHTSKSTPVKPFVEGGEITLLDTAAQNGAKTLKAATRRGVDLEAMEFKPEVLDAAYGGYWTTDGWYALPAQTDPKRKFVLIRYESTAGDTLYRGGNGTIIAGDESEVSFTDLNSIPLKVNFEEDIEGNNTYLGGSLLKQPAATPEA